VIDQVSEENKIIVSYYSIGIKLASLLTMGSEHYTIMWKSLSLKRFSGVQVTLIAVEFNQLACMFSGGLVGVSSSLKNTT